MKEHTPGRPRPLGRGLPTLRLAVPSTASPLGSCHPPADPTGRPFSLAPVGLHTALACWDWKRRGAAGSPTPFTPGTAAASRQPLSPPQLAPAPPASPPDGGLRTRVQIPTPPLPATTGPISVFHFPPLSNGGESTSLEAKTSVYPGGPPQTAWHTLGHPYTPPANIMVLTPDAFLFPQIGHYSFPFPGLPSFTSS